MSRKTLGALLLTLLSGSVAHAEPSKAEAIQAIGNSRRAITRAAGQKWVPKHVKAAIHDAHAAGAVMRRAAGGIDEGVAIETLNDPHSNNQRMRVGELDLQSLRGQGARAG